MASRKILKETIVLSNYLGEVNDFAAYQDTILTFCYCTDSESVSKGRPATKENESVRLYLFDFKTLASSSTGKKRTYLPYEQWKALDDKSSYWTLNDNGRDYFVKEGQRDKRTITGFSHKTTGSRRMWHFEVDAK